jgi:hypothetical protein
MNLIIDGNAALRKNLPFSGRAPTQRRQQAEW